ncbi:hypothetical protein HMPREF9080_01064 [Cardiobacterium valvarum F0432]|uniref:Uncharacterized protein n=1 Tax=Cardiobacterium valvarum F0432 TaxID=797473 RepID=G9ZE80_9GAMM|nr:hypothetical protein HMPREF9080_01064 [Cardiobacterium valvarum F0432]
MEKAGAGAKQRKCCPRQAVKVLVSPSGIDAGDYKIAGEGLFRAGFRFGYAPSGESVDLAKRRKCYPRQAVRMLAPPSGVDAGDHKISFVAARFFSTLSPNPFPTGEGIFRAGFGFGNAPSGESAAPAKRDRCWRLQNRCCRCAIFLNPLPKPFPSLGRGFFVRVLDVGTRQAV